jgi:hypothetical protein
MNQPAAAKRRNRPNLSRRIVRVCLTVVCVGIGGNLASGQSTVRLPPGTDSQRLETNVLPKAPNVINSQAPRVDATGGPVAISIEPMLSNKAAPVRHVGSGPIDLSNLSADILNCDICRQRLGLPALKSQAMSNTDSALRLHSRPAPAPTVPALNGSFEPIQGVRMLGSPGLMTPATAAQMASGGLVVEEFKPPQAEPDSIRLNGIPLEVRQQFLQNLDLPFGAKIMSAQVHDPKKPAASSSAVAEDKPSPESQPSVAGGGQESIKVTQESQATESKETRSLGAPGIVSQSAPIELGPPKLEDPAKEELADLKRSNEALQERLKELAETQAVAQSEKEKVMTSELQRLADEKEKLAKRISEMEEQQRQAQEEIGRRMAQADAANKEVLSMLEKRTAEVTQLQAQLKDQQEKQKVQAKAEAKKQAEKKKPPKKGKEGVKNAPKPSIET